MTYALGAKSLAALAGVHPDLIRVVKRAIQISEVDFKVICGVRTLAEQKALYAQGRTKPGKVVTWTLKSRHLPDPKTGLGRAVDLLPAPYDWKDLGPFTAVADAMMKAARELGVPIRWGANWDGDAQIREKGETDNPHFEMVG
tara:strand:- start:13432 stop:13860 length:429 start_codon:yes stop_codon:yes gene_type:complete